MANNVYTNYANKLLGNGTHDLADWDTSTIKAVLIDHADVTPNLGTHQDLDDIDASPVATSAALSPSISGGAVDVVDFAFAEVTGDAAESINYYMDSGSANTSPLLLYFDTATGLPVTPNGADINVVHNASGLCKLIL